MYTWERVSNESAGNVKSSKKFTGTIPISLLCFRFGLNVVSYVVDVYFYLVFMNDPQHKSLNC